MEKEQSQQPATPYLTALEAAWNEVNKGTRAYADRRIFNIGFVKGWEAGKKQAKRDEVKLPYPQGQVNGVF